MTEISTARTQADYDAFAAVVTEYVDWCRTRYADLEWFVRDVFSHQSLQTELDALSTAYGPPKGKTLLIWRDGEICGGGAYRVIGDGICEMKRLYVLDKFRGEGLGRTLCQAMIDTAKADGFHLMRLDTGDRLAEAIKMYQAFGFRPCPPYHDYPAGLMAHLVFMELPLTDKG
jgi:GNAT superfamily N-acetyltransferase